MSMFVSITSPEAALLLTDGASYDAEGVVQAIGPKVYSSRRAPLSVTTRGHARGGEAIARAICRMADEVGAEAVMGMMQDIANNMRDVFGQRFSGDDGIQVVIAAHTAAGGAHLSFSTVQTQQGFDQPAWRVFQPPAVFATGPFIDTADIIAGGIAPRAYSEPMSHYIERVGADIMEMMRKRPARRLGHAEDDKFFGVGGRADLTIIDADGCKTETIREWPDRVGEKITP